MSGSQVICSSNYADLLRQRSCELGRANSAMSNDLFGCGTLGVTPDNSCSPLDRSSADRCGELVSLWSCPSVDGFDEAHTVVKPGPDAGAFSADGIERTGLRLPAFRFLHVHQSYCCTALIACPEAEEPRSLAQPGFLEHPPTLTNSRNLRLR